MAEILWLSFEEKGGGGEHGCSRRCQNWLKCGGKKKTHVEKFFRVLIWIIEKNIKTKASDKANWEQQLPSRSMLIITIIQW